MTPVSMGGVDLTYKLHLGTKLKKAGEVAFRYFVVGINNPKSPSVQRLS